VTLAHGGVLLFTDGLLDALARHRHAGATLLDGILASVAAFTTGHPLEDDISLVTATAGLPGLA
jgi:hypothetical protein